MTAAHSGQVLALKTLRHRGAAIDVLDDNGRSCVFLAAQANHVPVLRVGSVTELQVYVYSCIGSNFPVGGL